MESGLKAGDFALFPGGGGGLGIQGVQLATALGMRAIVVDSGDDRKELCLRERAEAFVDFRKVKDTAAEVIRLCDGIGAHGVFVTAPAAYPTAIAYVGTRVGATLMCVGIRMHPFSLVHFSSLCQANYHKASAGTMVIGASPEKFVIQNMRIKGTLVASRADISRTLDFAKRGVLKPIHSVVYPIDRLPEAVEKMRKGETVGRSVVDFNL
jgi:D-arabinose 1-dehydrogenase-like Zn-dependent alcohol dehydrogenase